MRKIIILEALVHLMGLRSSPGVASYCLRLHASNVKAQFDLAIFLAIMLAFYVDDYLSSLRTVEEAAKMKKDLTLALALGGFQL